MQNQTKLPADFKAKWLEALRSGEYKQGRFALCSDGKYCGLGVACAIQGVEDLGGGHISRVGIQDEIFGEVPDVLRGIANNNPVVSILVKMNDADKATFLEIADWIQENL